ncbi:hypothetical protein PLESTB_000691300 [Pleodorina starrii]|uniref:NFACT RNA-binding domain-containing protein n=1 Tax=Pleodorina starrii TaxID=330485 RepID=A0A9W6F192_9CHLO|nr:hypothetical protein PLESTM_001226000 [Pleodorina starrii]GLC52948.1 hypothetical protein PLESTB_000691300 [Pleodorina starrii]GLC65244.1 hypothetical protein PLESTF_000267600 [Pleodorina starrii]
MQSAPRFKATDSLRLAIRFNQALIQDSSSFANTRKFLQICSDSRTLVSVRFCGHESLPKHKPTGITNCWSYPESRKSEATMPSTICGRASTAQMTLSPSTWARLWRADAAPLSSPAACPTTSARQRAWLRAPWPATPAAHLATSPPPQRTARYTCASASTSQPSAALAEGAVGASAVGPAATASSSHSHSRGSAAAGGAAGGGSDSGGGAGFPAKLQPVDYSTLAACCAELRSGWVPAKVEQVVMPDKTSLCLRLRTPAGQGWLRISWHPAAGRVTMMTQGSVPERGNASELYSLGEQIHGALSGLVLVDVALPAAWERVADLRFGVRPGEAPSHHLYCEVMARYSNVVLTTADGEVLAAAYQVGGMMSSHRQVQVGRTYALPPQLFGVPPTATAVASLDAWRDTVVGAAALAAAAQRQAAEQRRSAAAAAAKQQQQPPRSGAGGGAAAAAGGGRLVDGFIRAFHGVSPTLVEELCGAVGVSPEASPGELVSEQWAALHGQWRTWQERLISGDFAATSDPATGRYSVFGSLPRRHASVHEMLEDYYGPLTAAEAHAQLYGKLAAAVTAALKKARGKVRAFEQQLSESGRSEEIRRVADLITANLYRIPAGSATAVVEDWETGEPLTLELDASKPPVATAEALYRKARKLRRAIDVVQPLLDEARAEVAYLEDVEVGLAALKRWSGDAADAAALREVQDELVSGKYMKPPPDAALAVKTAARATKAAARAAAKKGGGKKGGGGGAKGGAAALAAAAAAAAADGGLDTASARRYTSPGGFTVLVGRNNKQNDVLSTQVAADDDLWFHVRGMPGSHTLLRVPRGAPTQPSDADLQFAADLAAFFSRARESLKADVIVARGAWVRKPRGAKPGAVMVTRELRNVVGRPGDSAAAEVAAVAGDGAAGKGGRR